MSNDTPRFFSGPKFLELFGFPAPKGFPKMWSQNYEDSEIKFVLNEVSSKWYKSHPNADRFDLAKIISAVLRSKAEYAKRMLDNNHSGDAQ